MASGSEILAGKGKPSTSGHDNILGNLKGLVGKVFGSRPVKTALNVIDTPRAAVVSTAQELADVAQGEGFSPKDWLKQVREHEGAGQLVQDIAPNAPIWVKRGAGLAGDLAADPLNWILPGASAAEGGAIKVGTALKAREVAELAAKAGRLDLAEDILKNRTAAGLSAADKAELNIKTGLRFGTKNHNIAFGGELGDKISRIRAAVTNPAIDAAGNLKANISEKLGVKGLLDPIAKSMADLRRNTPLAARGVERALRLSRAESRGAVDPLLSDLSRLARSHGSADGDVIRRAMESDALRATIPTTAKERVAAEGISHILESGRQEAERLTGRSIPKLPEYFPHQATEEFKAVLEDSGKRGGTGARAAFEKHRANRVGQSWFGEVLTEKTASVDGMEAIAKAALGSDYVKVFKGDPWAVAQGYLHGIRKMAEHYGFEKKLTDSGLVHYFDETATERAAASAGANFKGALKDFNAADAKGGLAAKIRERMGEVSAKDAAQPELKAARSAGAEATRAGQAVDVLGEKASNIEEYLGQATPPPEAAVSPEHAGIRAQIQQLADARSAITEQRTAAEAERAGITKGAAEASRAADVDRAALSKTLDYTSMSFNRGKAAEALRQFGDGKLDALATKLEGKGGTPRTIIGEARTRINAIDEEASQAALARHANVVSAEDVGGKLATPSDTVALVRALDARIGRLVKKDGKLSDQMAKLDELIPETDATAAANSPTAFDKHIAKTQERLNEVNAKLETAKGRRAEALQRQEYHLNRAAELADAARTQPNKDLAEVARLESLYHSATAEADRLHGSGQAKINFAVGLKVPERQAELERMIKDGLISSLKADPTRWANPDVAKVLNEISERASAPQVAKFIKGYDSVVARWKAYALLSPGYHDRNFLGGNWNNWQADVDKGMTNAFGKAVFTYRRAFNAAEEGLGREAAIKAVSDKYGEVWGRIFTEAERLNVWGGHNIMDLSDVGTSGSTGLIRRAGNAVGADLGKGIDALDPTSLNFAALKANVKTGEFVEKMLRGPLFADRIIKGFSAEKALEDVITYHFDYSELSQFEQTVLKRVIPFYTWSRKNFPLQVENFLRNPAKWNRYQAIKRNSELGTEKDAVVPAYFDRLFGIKTPWHTNGGDSLYVTPDLPITRLDEMLNGSALVNGITPALKLPIEVSTNHNFFTGNPLQVKGEEATVLPAAFAPLAPILEQLDGAMGLPRVGRDANGHYVMSRKDAYKVETALPLLGRLRRTAPNEKKYQDRATTSWLSTFLGVNARTLTADEIKHEMARRKG